MAIKKLIEVAHWIRSMKPVHGKNPSATGTRPHCICGGPGVLWQQPGPSFGPAW